MRAAALGMNSGELPRVAELWEQVRSRTGQAPTIVPIGAISQVAIALATARLKSRSDSPNAPTRWFTAMLSDENVPALLREIGTSFDPLADELFLERFTSKQRKPA